MFWLLQKSSWWLCVPPTFLALYFADLSILQWGWQCWSQRPMCLLLTGTCSWTLQETLQRSSSWKFSCLCVVQIFQLVRLSLCMVFPSLVLSLPSLTSDPHWHKKCHSDVWVDQEETEAHRRLPLFVVHPPALLADAMWVHHSFPKQGILKNWVKLWCRYRVADTRTHTALVFHSELGSG